MTRITDPAVLVETATAGLRVLRGSVLTAAAARLLAEVLFLEIPWLRPWQLEELICPDIARGKLLDDKMICDRARQIAMIAQGDRW